jgi:4-amino-4-deoxy-L-arabinose transferase-like glycosyltransferase
MSRITQAEMAGSINTQQESVHPLSQVRLSAKPASGSLRPFLLGMLVVGFGIGLLSAWHGGVLSVGDDGVSYLDLSDAWRNHDWLTAANGCWSPAYPVLLAAMLGVSHPSAFWEPVVIRGLNVLLYLGAMFSFAFFWRDLTRSLERRAAAMGTENKWPQPSWWLLGFALFLFFAVQFIGVSVVSPDLALFACVSLLGGIMVRIKDGRMNWGLFAWLGALCGIGYLVKAIMFPLTFVFLGVAFLTAGNKRRILPRLALALAVFMLIGGPWILMLSRAKGRLTYSDVGKLNYLWFASEGFNDYGYPFPWKPAPGEGTPVHPMRDLLASPHVFEFRAPFRGSYPLWDDPSYWYEGAKVPIHLRQQLSTLVNALNGYPHIIELQAALMVGALFLMLAAGSRAKRALKAWYLILPAVTAFALYAISHGLVQNRYTGPFLPLLWAGLFAELYLLHFRENSRLLAPLSLAMAIILSLPLAVDLSYNLRQTARNVHARTFFEHYDADVADYLQKAGLHPGASLGYLQAPEDGTNKYWARLAKMTIVVDMSFHDVPAFWEADPATQAKVLAAFRDAGVQAIVAYKAPASARSTGWQKVGRTDYYVLTGGALIPAQ